MTTTEEYCKEIEALRHENFELNHRIGNMEVIIGALMREKERFEIGLNSIALERDALKFRMDSLEK